MFTQAGRLMITPGLTNKNFLTGPVWEAPDITYLEFPSGVEFLQALHSLLSVHHGRHGGTLL